MQGSIFTFTGKNYFLPQETSFTEKKNKMDFATSDIEQIPPGQNRAVKA